MAKCQHLNVEEHDYRPAVACKGVRCVDCHAVMMVNYRGKLFLYGNRRRRMLLPVPLERKYWKVAPPAPDPMSHAERMKGYDNIHMVR